MGLLYVFPVSTEEADFVVKREEKLILKTYGLPYLFWIYALASIMVIFFMFLAIKGPVLKLISLGDETDALLGYSLLGFISLLPVAVLAFFFYEKRIIKTKDSLSLVHRIFGISVFTENFNLGPKDELVVVPFLSSPNVARLQSSEENLGFQNKGYFILWLQTHDGKKVQLDRHSRKSDLEKLKDLLTHT